ncbi:MAG: OmpA family protein [Methylacidiphilales bacterium]|nr:OmpA family protein [Candidatus Methylacidiphilales bacterium]
MMRTCLLLAAAALITAPLLDVSISPAVAQSRFSTSDLVDSLSNLETTENIDVAMLRQQAIIRARTAAPAVNRPPIAEYLFKLPQITVEVQFKLDSAVIRPSSYETLGSIADTLLHPYLLGYRFLVIGHTDATGRREYNIGLSQRRADAIREALVTVFKISPQRIQAIGLGEEQLQDPANPAAAINRRVQIVTIGKTR